MIPQVQERTIISGGARATSSFEISKDDTAHIMTILRDTLYSDKIMAVLREYGANAWDANRMVGKGDRPIKVTLPTLADPTLRIRDYGPGLSPEDVERIYTKYGASTKREDNLAVGMLGIGSKSGFAYSDSFAVTTWHGGRRREYVAVIDETQKGRMDLLLDVASDDETGVEISLAVRPQDIREFETRAAKLFQHFVPQPKINCALPKGPTGKRLEVDGKVLGVMNESTAWEDKGKWTAVMGCVPYRIDLNQLGRLNSSNGESHEVSRCASQLGGVLYFEIGDLTVAASREELKYSELTRINLIARINELVDEYVKQMLAGLDQLTQWERRLRIRQVSGMGLPIPTDQKQYDTSYITLKPTKDALGKESIVTLTTKNYRESFSKNETLRIDRTARFVVKDDKRTLKGFDMGSGDILVSPVAGTSQFLVMTELKRMIKAEAIEGVPVVMLSTLPWTAPPRSSPTGLRDAAKAKAQLLKLNPTTPDFGGIPLSRHWDVVSHAASDKDVYVVLESYRVNSHVGPTGDFYEQYMADSRLLKDLGLTLPPVIGYKEMTSKPLDLKKIKGTDYGKWRSTGLVELMKTHAKMKAVLEAIENGGETSYDVDVVMLEKHLGNDHEIVLLAHKINDARSVIRMADNQLLRAARYVRQVTPDKVDHTAGPRKDIMKRYPLLAVPGIEAAFGMYSSHKNLWVDYVLMVDVVNMKGEKENAA